MILYTGIMYKKKIKYVVDNRSSLAVPSETRFAIKLFAQRHGITVTEATRQLLSIGFKIALEPDFEFKDEDYKEE